MTAEGKKRKGHGEVNVEQLPSGRWRWRVWAKIAGKSVRLTGSEDTEKKARVAGQAARVNANAGRVAANRAASLGPYLEAWLAGRDGLAAGTRKKYADLLRLHILPALGTVRLAEVTPAMLRTFYEELRDGAGLGYSSRRQVHNILHAALDTAAADGLIPGNPAAVRGVRPVQQAREVEPVRAFTPEQAARFLAVADAEGERTGQVLALSRGQK